MSKKGFTLIELLIVISILGVLTVISVANFRVSQMRARDATRKHDLEQVAKALEAYFNDHRTYPLSTEDGLIECITDDPCSWGEAMYDGKTNYMVELPEDRGRGDYRYSSNGTSFYLYAHLENNTDPDNVIYDALCGGTLPCTYVYKSTNASPAPEASP